MKEIHKYIYKALRSEGLSPKEMTFMHDCVVMTNIGFFTYKKEPNYKYPYLCHFYVNKNQRNLKNFMRLVREVKRTMFSIGSVIFVAQEPSNKSYLGSFIKFSGGIKFCKKAGHTYYLVPVLKRKKHANL